MICGNKWKTCDCPWFSYETVVADRLGHMNLAQGPRGNNDEDRRAPIRFQEEVDRRRQQERRDAAMARRMQMLEDTSNNIVGDGNPGQQFGIGNAADHFLNHDFRQQATNILTGNIRQAARTAVGLVNGALTGRENPLPPAPFELPTPARDAASHMAQLRRDDSTSNATSDHDPILDWTNPRPRAGLGGANHATDVPVQALIPLPAPVPNGVRMRNQIRRASRLESLFADAGRSQPADDRAAEERIASWRSNVPVGEPADGVTSV